MFNRKPLIGISVGLSVLMVGCAGTPEDNERLVEARSLYGQIENDTDVVRSGPAQLRSAKTRINEAEELQEEDASDDKVEHVSYLALRHAQIAHEQGKQAKLQEEIDSAEQRREEMMLQMRTDEAQQARQESQQLRREMERLQAEQTDRGMVLTLGDVLFGVNEASLKQSGEQTVQRLAEFMREYEDRRVRVEGYTDSTGDAAYNQELSERRARSVKKELTERGIDGDRIEVQGFGEAHPVASNDTASGRQQNRRVEIVISDQEGNIQSR